MTRVAAPAEAVIPCDQHSEHNKRWRLLRKAATGLLVSSLSMVSGLSLDARAASYSFGYDEAGRLIQMQGTAGSAVYQYDTAGNLVAVTVPGSSAVAISDFTPNTAPVGASVVLTGVGFSSTASSNTVKFNGVTATVTAAGTNSLTVTVPTGATTGAISVAVAGNTGSSAGTFTVVASAPDAQPTVSAVNKTVAAAGDSVTVTGTNFLGSGANLWVRVNGLPAIITSVTATQLVFTVPSGPNSATSGRIEIGTQNGTVLQTSTFYVAPSGTAVSDVGAMAALNIGGSSLATGLSANQVGLYVFDGVIGQHLGLGVSGVSMASGYYLTVSVLAPNGTVLTSCTPILAPGSTATTTGGSCELATLPETGTYTVMVAKPSSAATFSLTLSEDLEGTLAVNQAPQNFLVSRVGQSMRYTFNANAGDNYTVNWSGASLQGDSSYIYVYRPDGTLLKSQAFNGTPGYYPNGQIDLRHLPVGGEYVVLVSPLWSTSGSVNIALNAVGGLLPLDGTQNAIALPVGQNGYYTFNGNAGQHLGLGISGLSTTPASSIVTIAVLNPDGTTLATCSTAVNNSCNVPAGSTQALPSDGQYTVVVTPAGGSSANLILTLSKDVTDVLTNGVSKNFSTQIVGQNARFSFIAAAGQNIDLLWSGNTFNAYPPAYLVVTQPDGTVISPSTQLYSDASGLTLTNLQQTGLYTVFIDPQLDHTGQVNLKVIGDSSGNSIQVGGSAVMTLQPGQNGEFTFNGTAGQHLALGVTSSSNALYGAVQVNVFAPDGVTLLNEPAGYVTCNHGTPIYVSSIGQGSSCNLTGPMAGLPSTGTYTVRLTQLSTPAANLVLNLTLSSDASDSLGSAVKTYYSSVAGQNGRYTFSATAGQDWTVQWSNDTFGTGASSGPAIYVFQPDGSQISLSTTSLNASSGSLSLPNLQQTGTYTVLFDRAGTVSSIGQVDLQGFQTGTTPPVVGTPDGTLSINGSAAVTVPAGAKKIYTFSGTLDQRLSLGVGGLSGSDVKISVIASDGVTVLGNSSTCGNTVFYASYGGGSCGLTAPTHGLPATGTYTVSVTSQGSSTANLTMSLTNDAVGVLNGSATTFTTSTLGQSAQYSINGKPGQSLTVWWGNGNLSSSLKMQVYQPDGSLLPQGGWIFGSGGSTRLSNLQQAGIYTVFLAPDRSTSTPNVGTLDMKLVTDVVGGTPLTVGGTLSISASAGQYGTYTFNGTVGQHLGLGVSNLTPGGSSASVTVTAPSGTTLQGSCSALGIGNNGTTDVGNSCNVTNPMQGLPVTGTYTVQIVPSSSLSLTLSLSEDQEGSLDVNGSSATFTTSTVGQNGRYVFSGAAGGRYKLKWSNYALISGSPRGFFSDIKIYAPDGSLLTSSQASTSALSGELRLPTLPLTGTYTVFVDPSADAIGSISLQIVGDVAVPSPTIATVTTLTVSTNPVLVGQNVMLTAVVQGSSPSGTVNFYDGSTLIGSIDVLANSASVQSGQTTFVWSGTLSGGFRRLTAVYLGDAVNKSSTSKAVTETVNPDAVILLMQMGQ